jgi:Tfp pilus assembly protein PilX
VDLGTRVTTAFDSSRAVVREIHFKRGVLTTRSAMQETKTYTIKNVDAKAKTLVIEHGQRPGYTLLERKPSETTPNAYRFEVKLAASGTETFPVREERVYDETTSVTNLTPDVLAAYVQNKALSEAARRQLDQILQKKREVAANDAALRQAEADLNSLSQDQTRIRSNIESLNRVSGQQDQVQQYARQLAAAETKLATLRDTQSDLRKKKAALEAELNSLMERTEF